MRTLHPIDTLERRHRIVRVSAEANDHLGDHLSSTTDCGVSLRSVQQMDGDGGVGKDPLSALLRAHSTTKLSSSSDVPSEIQTIILLSVSSPSGSNITDDIVKYQ